MNQSQKLSFIFAAILIFWAISFTAAFAHEITAPIGQGGPTCVNVGPGPHILVGTTCRHPSSNPDTGQVTPTPVATGGNPAPKPTCPSTHQNPGLVPGIGNEGMRCQNTAGERTLVTWSCPAGYEPQPEGNTMTCKTSTGSLQGGSLNIDTRGYTPFICFQSGSLPTIAQSGNCPEPLTGGIAQYVARIYQFSLMVVGLLALAGLTLGAVKYTLSAGNIVSQQEAREQMFAALYGLLILLGAYLILNTINPELVNLQNPATRILNVPRTTDTTGGTPTRSNLPANNSTGGSTSGSAETGIPTNQASGNPASSGRTATCPQTNKTWTAQVQSGCPRPSSCYLSRIDQNFWSCISCNTSQGYENQDGVCIKI